MLRIHAVFSQSRRGLLWPLAGLALALVSLVNGQSLAELQAAAKKHDPAAQYQLGRRYLLGIGTTIDEKEGFKYLREAADRGNLVEAIHLVAVCYATEIGVRKSEKLAVKYFEKAATAGYGEAQFKLAACYENGLLAVKPDKTVAMKWYLAAAQQGHPRAQYKYAMLVYQIPDYAGSAEWFRKAADQGVIEAQMRIAEFYKLGRAAGGKDLVEAYKWYLIASRLGYPDAVKQVEEFPRLWRLDEESARKAMERADAYFEQHRTP